ncbi:MAG: ABC transporter ATP-binding protein/permease [Thermoguttaceae bacterium]|nr:ABC transporter ATP-binding protein/permease [Thermoguttaceae bacterium]MDW8037517.1 ABC transporter ATP-binding protein [Thermoguttaceae bacterium]
MRNFARAIRLSLRYRWTFFFSILCAVGVGVFWGANIGAVYPFVEIIFQGESLQRWAQRNLARTQQSTVQYTLQVQELQRALAQAPEAERPRLETKLSLAESRLAAERRAEQLYEALQPYFALLPDSPFQTLVLVIGLLMFGTLIKCLFQFWHGILVGRLAALGEFELRKLFYRRTLRLETAAFTEEDTTDLMSRFTYDMECLTNGLNVLFGKVVREPLKALACLAGAAWVCWPLLVLTLLVLPVAVWAIQWLGKMLKRANRRAMEGMAELYNILEETFRGIQLVKAFTMERYERLRFHRRSKQYFRKSLKIARYDSLSHPLTEMLGIAMISLALGAGAYLTLEGKTHLLGIRMSDRPLSVGALLLFYAFLIGTADPARKLSDVFSRLQRAAAAADRIYALLDREPKLQEPACPMILHRHQRDLVFDHVWFGYREDRHVLEDICLEIPFGQRLAIVGPNGAGKTTLLNLVLRFADPLRGQIRLDGVPLPQMRLQDLRRQIGLVTQEPWLFDDTVYNNIRYGAPWASREDVIRAAQQAHAHQFIVEELPDGYETLVGMGGSRLSGGQRQRITLARAILRDPAILLLDEPTSQVDPESQRLIRTVLEEFTRNRTTLMVTHRLSTLALADRIVVMEAGRIVDVGSHEQLLARCSTYRRLYQFEFAPLRESA